MEVFKNKFLIKLIATICLILTIFNFLCTKSVYAAEEKDEVWGGVLLKPIIALMTSLGDATMEILHQSIQSQDAAIIKIDGVQDHFETLASALAVTFAIIAAVAFIAVVVAATGGIAAGAAALAGEAAKAAFIHAAVNTAGGALVGGAVVGVIAGVAIKDGMIPNDMYLPAFSITAEQIFRNELALFDVNFFNPSTYYTEEVVKKPDRITGESSSESITVSLWVFNDKNDLKYTKARDYAKAISGEKIISVADARNEGFGEIIDLTNEKLTGDKIENNMDFKIYEPTLKAKGPTQENFSMVTGEATYNSVYVEENTYVFGVIKEGEQKDYLHIKLKYDATTTTHMPLGTVTFQATEDLNYSFATGTPEQDGVWSDYETQKVEITSTAAQLQGVVAEWYFILRNMALLILMLILIYIGIRIVIGSTAGEKAKYKERLTDWLVALCLIFIMHYIMVFAIELVEKITDFVGIKVNGNMAYIGLTDVQRESAEEVLEGYDTTGDYDGIPNVFDDINKGDTPGGRLVWPTDLVGRFRIESQLTEAGTTLWVGYSLCYVILVLFTLFFAFTYAKRVVYMAFLTMIAPLVAMTYPIDKMTDGKAQAFDSWLKEYIFNLMIQPLHLLLYTILVSSAYTLASKSPLYAIVAIGFLMPAEKLMRRFFGFEKAKTPGLLGGAAGAALAMTGLQKIMGHNSKGKHASGNNGGKDESTERNTRYTKNNGEKPLDVLFGDSKLPEEEGESKEGKLASKLDTSKTDKENKSEGASKDTLKSDSSTQNKNEQTRRIVSAIKTAQLSEEQKQPEKQHRKEAIKEKARRIGRTIKGVSGAYGRTMGHKAMRRVQNARPIRAMARGAAGLVGGLAFGMVGATLGVASGDPSKAFQYASTGAVGGYGLGKGVAGSAVDTFSVDSREMEEEAERAWYGEEYAQHKYEQAEEYELMSEKNISYYRDLTGGTREEAEEFLDNKGREYYDSRVTDVGEMLAIEQLMKDQDEQVKKGEKIDLISEEEAIAAARLKKAIPGKVKEMTDKKEKEYRDTYAKVYEDKLKKQHSGWENNEELANNIKKFAEEKADRTIRIMKTLESKKSDLTTL